MTDCDVSGSGGGNGGAPGTGAARGVFRMSEGDWVCANTQCGNINFARRTSCNRCNKEKEEIPNKKKIVSEIGKAAAEKSRGLFSADDWQCVKCGNVNWARRSTCNMCNAPKFVEVEERTGLGGGFNERGVVEYKQREDSDSEYDDFGRRKRRREKENSSSKSRSPEQSHSQVVQVVKKTEEVKPKPVEVTPPKEVVEEVEEDEEEEDEGDEDLSKYDLWGDEEEAEPPIPPPPKISLDQNINLRSRSRSRSPLHK